MFSSGVFSSVQPNYLVRLFGCTLLNTPLLDGRLRWWGPASGEQLRAEGCDHTLWVTGGLGQRHPEHLLLEGGIVQSDSGPALLGLGGVNPGVLLCCPLSEPDGQLCRRLRPQQLRETFWTAGRAYKGFGTLKCSIGPVAGA